MNPEYLPLLEHLRATGTINLREATVLLPDHLRAFAHFTLKSMWEEGYLEITPPRAGVDWTTQREYETPTARNKRAKGYRHP